MYRILTLLAYLITTPALAAAGGTAGFLESPIWHTPDAYYPGETVRIYAALMNNSAADIAGDLYFYVNDKAIGSRPFTMRSHDQVVTVWYDWQATPGTHTFSARIANTEFFAQGSSSVAEPRLVATSPHLTATTSVQKVDVAKEDMHAATTTASLGETLDSLAETVRTSLEETRTALDTKIDARTGRVAGTSTVAEDIGDESVYMAPTTTTIKQSSGFFQSLYLWVLKAMRGFLSLGIGILKNPLWTALALVAVFIAFMKLVEMTFRAFTGSKQN